MQELLYFCSVIEMKTVYLLAFFALFTVAGCQEQRKQQELTPWGSPVGDVAGADTAADAVQADSRGLSLEEIVAGGELIMLTVNGPETYYNYHNHGMGLQYLLCERFARQIGVSLRVEECKDTAEMVNRLARGEGDLIAVPLSDKDLRGAKLRFCGVSPDSLKTQWAVAAGNKSLADTLRAWFRPDMIAQTRQEEAYLLSSQSIRRHVFSPFLNRSKGVISKYDRLFQKYAPSARMDWRLMAAQCYQESCFDPNAKSWAGACGLMQIMPSTAQHLGLPMASIHEPEANVAAAARYMAELQGLFSDVRAPGQRILFALAAYNGGFHHIRDAMALTRKYGGNPQSWADVSGYVLRLSQRYYYTDPVVEYGYMRGSETADYVERIRARWSEYSGGAPVRSYHKPVGGGSNFHDAPVKAKRKYEKKYHI